MTISRLPSEDIGILGYAESRYEKKTSRTLIAMLAEQFSHERPSPPLSPTFMPLVLHFVKSGRHISGEG